MGRKTRAVGELDKHSRAADIVNTTPWPLRSPVDFDIRVEAMSMG
jgi:hypothetical protein